MGLQEDERDDPLPMMGTPSSYAELYGMVARIEERTRGIASLARDYRRLGERVQNIELTLAGGPDAADIQKRLGAIEASMVQSSAKSGVWAMIGGQAWNVVVSALTSSVVVAAIAAMLGVRL
jgi:hypothetical protein